MRPRRIYVPLTHEQVRDLATERRLAAPLQGYAAGSPGRVDARISPAAAQEDAEYLAFLAAAAHGARLDEGARRVIASADAPDEAIREVSAPAGGPPMGPVPVVIAEDLPLRAVASTSTRRRMSRQMRARMERDARSARTPRTRIRRPRQ